MKVALLEAGAKIPTRKHPADAGLDLYAFLENGVESITIEPGTVEIVRTGITVEIPAGYFGWITNKSRSNYLIGGGIVDEGYQGELLVKIINPLQNVVVVVHQGDAIAQLLIIPGARFEIREVPKEQIYKKLTSRGSTGGIVTQVNT